MSSLSTVTDIRIERLRDDEADAYERFLARSPLTLLYHGAKYRRLLRTLLDADDWYLVARDSQGTIVGALPSFVLRDEANGSVLNSLPYYGSNGGLLEFDGNVAVKRQLLAAFDQLASDVRCVS